jgi:hypothetical protein
MAKLSPYFAKPCNCAESVTSLTVGGKLLAKNAVEGILRLFCKAVYRAKLALFFNGLGAVNPLVYLTSLWPALAYGRQTGENHK